jgi:thioredoxin 1
MEKLKHNMNIIEITDRNFEEQLRGPLPLLIDFTAAWCGPCRVIKPHVEAIADSAAGRLRVGVCDVDSNQVLAARLDVRAMPTLMLWKDGRMVGQIVGAVPRAKIEALVARALPAAGDVPAAAAAAAATATR